MWSRFVTLIAAVVLVNFSYFNLHAQSPANPADFGAALPRTSDGKPDLSGMWESGRLSTRPEKADGSPLGPSIITTRVPQMQAPYQPWAAAKVKESLAHHEIDDPMTRCLMAGVPRTMTNPFPFQIVQTPTQVVMLYEWDHTYRVIPTDGRGHPTDLDPSFMGDSIGRWDGDTLVVDVTGFNDKTWLDHGAHFHTEALHVVERYHRTALDTIEYEATLEDPNVMTKPWIMKVILKKSTDRIMEQECNENEKDISHLVGK